MRLTRRTYIMAFGISAGALMTGCAGMAAGAASQRADPPQGQAQ